MLNSDFLIVSGFASSPVSFGLPKETSGVLTCTTSVDFPISVFVEATVASEFSVTRLDWGDNARFCHFDQQMQMLP